MDRQLSNSFNLFSPIELNNGEATDSFSPPSEESTTNKGWFVTNYINIYNYVITAQPLQEENYVLILLMTVFNHHVQVLHQLIVVSNILLYFITSLCLPAYNSIAGDISSSLHSENPLSITNIDTK